MDLLIYAVLLLSLQTKPETIPCTVVNFDPHPTLACKGYEKALEIPYAVWPVEWHGPELGFTYEIKVQRKGDDLFSGEFVRSQPDLEAAERNRQKSRVHQLRWMRESLQNPRKGN